MQGILRRHHDLKARFLDRDSVRNKGRNLALRLTYRRQTGEPKQPRGLHLFGPLIQQSFGVVHQGALEKT